MGTDEFIKEFKGAKISGVACLGGGPVGTCTMATMASRMPDVQFTVFDDNPTVVCGCQSGPLPFFEPGLEELLEKVRGKNLSFTSSLEQAVSKSQVIFVSINTPLKTSGTGGGRAPDLSGWDKMARRISKASNGACKILVECSPLPVTTGETMRKVLAACGHPGTFEVLCLPSFHRGGNAIEDLSNTETKVLLGSQDTPAGNVARETISELIRPWISGERIVHSNVWSAEISKLAQNAFIAQRISSVNAVSMLCEKTGADLDEVMRVIGSDSRLGPGYLKSCAGMGGPVMLNNLKMLIYLCESLHLPDVAEYWTEVLRLNEYQSKRFCDNIVNTMVTAKGKKIAILGFAYKAGSSDVRESQAIAICKSLLAEQCHLAIVDPQVSLETMMTSLDMSNPLMVERCSNAMDALKGASACVLVTDWDEFKTLDWKAAAAIMEKPPYFFDSRDFVSVDHMKSLGFDVYSIGRARD
mmetsp:Transcript_43037/g.99925  ORF Transcript_43037/g.99925 Transcript_43037/m.99925 type:complete len:470 (+) Transcript_43037:301-1710(+)|eukprot:CAMPEP_0114137204 /NCGR_PEP_ID=MMETSP0043_2-20121206/15651_1 /TAXON_ID=464988 /ORGANISM="Hemiselmis andersenii, Strain CCMP644" /LENGTH=469 /DNA_ID=CAMNT_0001231065 /DNA_START=265 /DNA_END=1674 /DNA_ORIENTATION=+